MYKLENKNLKSMDYIYFQMEIQNNLHYTLPLPEVLGFFFW